MQGAEAEFSNDDWFGDEQFDIQLELEELSVDEVRERSASGRTAATAQGVTDRKRVAFALRIWAALHQSPLLSYEEADERFDAWCEGAALRREEMYRAIESVVKCAGDDLTRKTLRR